MTSFMIFSFKRRFQNETQIYCSSVNVVPRRFRIQCYRLRCGGVVVLGKNPKPYETLRNSRLKAIPHDTPPNIYVIKASHTFGAVGGVGGFSLLYSGNWKIESDSDWLTIPQIYQSGSDTDCQTTDISFQVIQISGDSGSYDARKAIITATEIRPDGSTGNSIRIEVNQNNH